MNNEQIYQMAHEWVEDFAEGMELGDDLAALLLEVRWATAKECALICERHPNIQVGLQLAQQIRDEFEMKDFE